MGILRNGCKTKRSSSPVMIQDAFAATASSRNLLSLGSRQAVMEISGIMVMLFLSMRSIMAIRSSSKRNYVSNFFRYKTSMNSVIVSLEDAIAPKPITLSKTLRLVELGVKAALIKTLVSKIKKSVILSQNLLKDFLCKATFFNGFAYFIKKFFKIIRRIFQEFLVQSNVHPLRNSLSFFGRGQSPFFCRFFRNFNNNTVHNLNLVPIKNTKNHSSNHKSGNDDKNASKVVSLATSRPEALAFSYASVGLEFSKSNALRNTLVSKTKDSVIFVQYVIQNFFRKTIFFRFFSYFLQQNIELREFASVDDFINLLFQIIFKVRSEFRSFVLQILCSVFGDVDCEGVHNSQVLIPLKC